MVIQTDPLLVPFAVSVLITATIVYYAYGQLQTTTDQTVVGFFWLNLFTGIWGVSRLLQYLITSELVTQLLFAGIYAGYGGSMVTLFYFALAFTDKREWLSRRTIAAVSVVPAVALVLGVTNQWHSLLWTGEFQTQSGLYILQREFTLGFLLYYLYTQVFLWYSVYRLIRFVFTSRDLYRGQAVAVVIASAIPIVFGGLFVFDATPLVPEFVDLTPVGFALSGIFFGYAIFRFQLLDIVPIARDTVVESMRDGYVVLDENSRIVDLNDAAELVAREDGALGEPVAEVFPACAAVVAEHDHGTQEEAELSVEVDGEQRFLIATVSSLNDDDRLIGRLLLVRDVTERRAVQKRYQALIENSSDLIFVMDPDGTLTYASPSLRNVTGADPDIVQGESAFEFIHEDDCQSVRDAFDEVQANPAEKRRIEYRIQNRDGEWLTLEAELSNMLENPFVEGIVSNARNITERKKREQELEAVNEQLTQANEQLERFASVVSHDLRNPINVARGHLQIAQETGDEESFETVDDSLQRMEAIIDDVLTLAREGQSTGELEPTSLDAVAEDAWSHVDTEGASLDVTTDVTLEADPDRLGQLFENLFRNAVEHGSTSHVDADASADAAEHGGTDLTVRVGWDGNSFFVEDDGPGIPEDRREEVFEAGETTNQNGTGLGLSIVQEIASGHGWEVSVTDGTDGGARFEFDGVAQLEPAD